MRDLIKLICGSVLLQFLPEGGRNFSNGAPKTFIERLINSTLIKQAAKNGDREMLRGQLASYWQGSSGDAFYDTFANRFEESFLNEHYVIVDELDKLLKQYPGQFNCLLELGCGNGAVIDHLATRMETIDSFFGIDINSGIIEKNQQTNKRDDVEFICGDALEYVDGRLKPETVLFSYGGVMEYFLESELVTMFEKLKAESPSLIVLTEPLYDGFDLEVELKSQTGGIEHSFSHNYPLLVKQAGFEVVFRKEMENEHRWVLLIAKG